MEKLLDDIYQEYLDKFETELVAMNAKAPRADALALVSLIEGATLFVGSDRRWESDKVAVREAVLAIIDARYGSED